MDLKDVDITNPWKTLSSELVYENPWIRLTKHDVLNPKGKMGLYSVVHFKNIAIGIIPLDKEMNTWIVGQFRFPLDQYSWEIIEGGGPLKDDPLDSAKRELHEEAGISAQTWIKIQEMHLSNSVTDELAIIYVAKDLSFHEAEPEESEKLDVRKLPFEEVYQMVVKGEITDSMSVAGILRLKILIDEGQI
jgi:ADP-ribose pyrophosphatase